MWQGSALYSRVVNLTELRSNVVFTFYLTVLRTLANISKMSSKDGIKIVGKATYICCNIVEFVILIWGSVVVFGAWHTWDEKNEQSENYCTSSAMMFAFVLLISRWVSGVESSKAICYSSCCGSSYVQKHKIIHTGTLILQSLFTLVRK